MAEVKYNEAYYEVEASRWIGGADASIAWVSFAPRNTESGLQHLAQLHCRFAADQTIHTCDVWPRDLLTKADLEALSKLNVVDVFLRFGRKPKLDAKGNPVVVKDPKTGKETWDYTDEYGQPKWVALITDSGEVFTANGGAVPFGPAENSASDESNEAANAE